MKRFLNRQKLCASRRSHCGLQAKQVILAIIYMACIPGCYFLPSSCSSYFIPHSSWDAIEENRILAVSLGFWTGSPSSPFLPLQLEIDVANSQKGTYSPRRIQKLSGVLFPLWSNNRSRNECALRHAPLCPKLGQENNSRNYNCLWENKQNAHNIQYLTDFCTFLDLGVLLLFPSHKYRKEIIPLLVSFLFTFGPIRSTERNNMFKTWFVAQLCI